MKSVKLKNNISLILCCDITRSLFWFKVNYSDAKMSANPVCRVGQKLRETYDTYLNKKCKSF